MYWFCIDLLNNGSQPIRFLKICVLTASRPCGFSRFFDFFAAAAYNSPVTENLVLTAC